MLGAIRIIFGAICIALGVLFGLFFIEGKGVIPLLWCIISIVSFSLGRAFFKGWINNRQETAEKASDSLEQNLSQKPSEKDFETKSLEYFERLSRCEDVFVQYIKLGKEYYYYNSHDKEDRNVAKLKVIQTSIMSFQSFQIEEHFRSLGITFCSYPLSYNYACTSDIDANYNNMGDFFENNRFPDLDVVPYPLQGDTCSYGDIQIDKLCNTKYEAQKLSANELEASLEDRMKEDVTYIPTLFKCGTVFYGRCGNNPITKYVIAKNHLLSDMTVMGEVVTKQMAGVVPVDELIESLKKGYGRISLFYVEPKDIDLLFKTAEELKLYEDNKREFCSIIIKEVKSLSSFYSDSLKDKSLYWLLESRLYEYKETDAKYQRRRDAWEWEQQHDTI